MASSKTKATISNQNSGVRKLKPVKSKIPGLKPKKKYREPLAKLPSAWKFFKQSIKHIWQHKKLFAGIVLVYLLLVMLLVKGLKFTSDIGLAKASFEGLFEGKAGPALNSLTVFGYLLTTSSPENQGAAVYQFNIVILLTLVIIWALRQTYANQKVTLKDAFYKSAYPIVQFVLVLLIIALQCLPFALGSFVFGSTVSSGVSSGFLQTSFWVLLSFSLVFWTVYMLSSSLFAMYIVTQPNRKPVQAIRSALNIVQYRRWAILRKMLFFPFMSMLLIGTVTLLVITFASTFTEPVFVLLSCFSLVLFHSYLYAIYRELL